MPLSTCSDAVQWVGAMFNSHGVRLVDASGQITVNSDATRAALEWFKRTAPFFPESVYAWDDASNNKALISGQSALIFNAPSALGGGEARPAEDRRAVVDVSAAQGSEGKARFRPLPLLGDLEFLAEQGGGEKPAAASLRQGLGREADRREPGFRRPALRQRGRYQRLGGSRSAQGYAL